MIDFLEIRKQHYQFSHQMLDTEIKECFTCRTEVWPCGVIIILDEFELFIKKIKFNSDITNSWILDYVIDEDKDKELIPHAHRSGCMDWRKCDCPPINEENGEAMCTTCWHPLILHGELWCNHYHDQPDWLKVGCTCSVVA